MTEVRFKPAFIRQYKKLSKALRQEIREKILLFQDNPRHSMLKTHALKGRLKGSMSFSVNYRYRIVFEWEEKDAAVLLAVGDHSVYG
ncbi:MAG: type II toxin-antitoxin system mRNA interferase toxin, RelE/StbE family [Candidatus Peribacteraceae bacterium]